MKLSVIEPQHMEVCTFACLHIMYLVLDSMRWAAPIWPEIEISEKTHSN